MKHTNETCMLHSCVLIDWMLCLFCHVCTLVDHLDHLEVIRMQFRAKFIFKVLPNYAFKNNSSKLGF